jgi:hypothetical protein
MMIHFVNFCRHFQLAALHCGYGHPVEDAGGEGRAEEGNVGWQGLTLVQFPAQR